MGKSLNGKELGKGISQRKDGLYQGRFTNRFGSKQTVYGKTYNEVRKKLREAQYEDEKCLNVVTKDVTLDEWFDIWMNTFKKNCRDSTKESYKTEYTRIQKELGWRKLTTLNLIILQEAFNGLCSDNARKATKKVLVDMLNKAVDTDLLTKNVAKQINTVVTKEETEERRVLTKKETEIFLEEAKSSSYYNLFVLAFETGLRIGEIMGLSAADLDFKKKRLYVRRTLCYFQKDGKYIFEMHACKTKSGKRKVPLTTNAINALQRQLLQKEKIEAKGKVAPEEYKNLLFVTKNNQPTQQFIVQEAIDSVLKHVRTKYPEFERFTPHCTRHTFATRCVEKKMQPKTLQRLLGHASITTTMDLYCHVTDETLEDALELMERNPTD